MTAGEMENRFAELRQSLAAGQIQTDEFQRAVAGLRYQAADGVWYQIDAIDGAWLSWDGRSWVRSGQASARPLATSPPVSPQTTQTIPVGGLPLTFGPLIRFIGRQTAKRFVKQLPLTILMMAGLFVLNMYIIAYKNDGYGKFKPGDRALGLGMNVISGGLSGGLVLGVVMTVGFGFLINAVRRGPSKAVGELARLPQDIARYFNDAGALALSGLAGGAGLAMLLGCLINGYANLAMAVGMGAMLRSGGGRVIALLLRAAWASTYGTVQGSQGKTFTVQAGYVAMFGGSMGFVLKSTLSTGVGFVGGVGLLILALVLATQSRAQGGQALSSLLLSIALLNPLALVPELYAHDGGRWETGGSFSGWIKTDGAQQIGRIAATHAAATGAVAGAVAAAAGAVAGAAGAAGAAGVAGATAGAVGAAGQVGGGVGGGMGGATTDTGIEPSDESTQPERVTPPEEDSPPGESSPPPADAEQPSRTQDEPPGETTPDSSEQLPPPAHSEQPPEQPDERPEGTTLPPEEPVEPPRHQTESQDTATPTPEEQRAAAEQRRDEGQQEQEAAAEDTSWWGIAGNTWTNITNEVSQTISDIGEGISNAAEAVEEAATDVYNDPGILTDTIWETGSDITHGVATGVQIAGNAALDAAEGVAQAAVDTYNNPELFGDTLVGMADDIQSGTEAIGNAVTNPENIIKVAETMSGLENFENSLDPNRSLPNRIGQVGLGVANLYGTLVTAGAAASGIRSGASNLIGRLPGQAAGLTDDAARLGAAGLLDDGAQVAAGAGGLTDDGVRIAAEAGGLTDDGVRAAAEAGGLTDDGVRAAAGTGGLTDDGVRAGAGGLTDDGARAGAGGLTDDGARAGGGAAGVTDDGARAGSGATGAADDGARAGGSKLSPEERLQRQSYSDRLRNRELRADSTIRPGDPSDFSVAEGVVADTSGYAKVSEKNIQMVADKYGVKIHTRPTNPMAKELLESGEALAKPQYVKTKSINPLDTYLGAEADEVGKVGYFKPKKPIAGEVPADKWDDVMKRYNTRAKEFADQAEDVANNPTLRREGNLIIDVETGKPFTGDVDGFAIRGMHNETLPKSVVEQIERELIQGPGHTKHGFHTEWDYSGYSRTAPTGGGQSPYDVSRGIDQTIRRGHAPVVKQIDPETGEILGEKAGEALVSYTGGEALSPGMSRNPTASWWHGGATNPLIKPPTP